MAHNDLFIQKLEVISLRTSGKRLPGKTLAVYITNVVYSSVLIFYKDKLGNWGLIESVLSRQNFVEFQENSQKVLEFLSNFLSFSLKFCDNLDRIGSGKVTNSVDPIRSDPGV